MNIFLMIGARLTRSSVRLMMCVALFAGAIAEPAHAAVPNGISGAWFNPAQGGHGLSVEVLGDGRAIVYWFVYDRDGAPLHLYIDAVVSERSITGTAYRHDGMRFGTFDSAELRQSVWGHVALRFDDCNYGTLTYNGDGIAGAGYGTGTIAIQRLSRLAEMDCDFGVSGVLPTGLYDVDVDPGTAFGTPIRLPAAVDPDGRLWATSPSATTSRGLPSQPNRVVIIGAAEARQPNGVPMLLRVFDNAAFARDQPLAGFSLRGGMATGPGVGDASGLFTAETPNALARTVAIRSRPPGQQSIRRPLSIPDLATGVYPVLFDSLIIGDRAWLRFKPDGSFCLSSSASAPVTGCRWQGEIRASHPGWTFFDFTITSVIGSATHHYAGRGWVEYVGAKAQYVVLVAADATVGAGFAAERRNAP
jgi:hypothetical protein